MAEAAVPPGSEGPDDEAVGAAPPEVVDAAADLERLRHVLDVHGAEFALQSEALSRAELELEATRDRYFELYELAPVGYLTLDPPGTILEANLRATLLLGVERSRLVGSLLSSHVPSDQAVALARHLRDVFAADERRGCELVLLGPDGGRRHARVESVAVAAAAGQPAHCRTVLVDVTPLREAEHARREVEGALRRREEELLHLQRVETIGHLAARLAHEYQNILMAMGGAVREAAEVAGRCPTGPCLAVPHLEHLRADVERGAALAAHVLAFSRREAPGRLPTRVDAQVAELEQVLCSLLRDDRVEVAVTRGAPEAWILAGQGWIEQIVLNLALNARDAMPRGGHLSIETRVASAGVGAEGEAHETVTLVVSDTGVGMTPEVQARAFEPFFTTKAGPAGTGLGLPTVRDLVARMSGRVDLRSVPGRGTTFEVHLPCARPTRAASGHLTLVAPHARVRPRTVLVVEDERLILRTVERHLRRAGHEALLAPGAPEALALLDAHPGPIDLLLLDAHLPVGGGQELVRAVRARHPALAVLHMSASPREELVAQGRIEAASATLEKPFSEEQLVQRLGEVLGAAGDGPLRS